MNQTTASPQESSTSAELEEQAARRTETIIKASSRVVELSERADLIERALSSMLPEFIALHPLGEVSDRFATLVQSVDRVEEAIKGLKSRISYAKEVSMPARLDAEEVQTFNTENYRITRTTRIMASIVSELQASAFAWLRGNNYEALIKETVNASSLSSAAKELMANGLELPEEEGFRVHNKDGISITRKKK